MQMWALLDFLNEKQCHSLSLQVLKKKIPLYPSILKESGPITETLKLIR